MNWQDEHTKRIALIPENFRKAHGHSSNHRQEIEGSSICGCFYCCKTFRPDEITEWVDENDQGIGQCALCPNCGIDSVIGSLSGFSIDEAFLKDMNRYWF
ncbi:cytoplasmic protein [Methylomicrobium sp. Wu6]|uniref:cytoplasmic protein n=1 Tax=Methylomicrobium sp. Wu6 TaxID=3107928 RepID=UPI002DD6AC46|nr:cytoplasmic protein [Methylomicrobium sp. Wu6]MEC4747523.1 cytoplasmic protein [Methylomicrobium sp. Wu6]